jgi:putative copper resistance protein D
MNGWAASIRSLHILSLFFVAGSSAFVLLIARPAFKKSGMESLDIAQRLNRFQLKLVFWALLTAFLTLLLGLLFQVAVISGRSPEQMTLGDIGSVITGTQYGAVWITRLSLLLLSFLFAMSDDWGRGERRTSSWTNFLLACALLVTLPWSGHAAAGEGMVLLIQLAADALHLVAAALWLGGLLPLALLLHWTGGAASALPIAQEATGRFSLLGLACVSLLVITGFLNAWSLVGGFAALLGTAYGRLLLTKLGVMLLLIALAGFNRQSLKPKLLALSSQASLREFQPLLGGLKRNVVAEAVLGVLILVVVGWMAFTPPARHSQLTWPFSFRWSWATVQTNPRIRPEIFFGTALAAFGFVCLCAAALRRAERPWTIGVGLASVAYGAAVTLPTISTDAYPTTYMRPSVTYHAISVANGLHLYRENCALCHGVAGYGDGPVAEDLKPKPADLTAKHTGDHTAGDLFWWLSEGIPGKAMPGFGAALSQEERWDLINFMRALSAAERARSMAPIVESEPWLVAPDFSYRTTRGEERTLKDHRQERIVLLVLFTRPQSRERLVQIDQAYAKLKSLGVEVLAIPQDERELIPEGATRLHDLAIVTDGGQEAFEVYALFRRSFSAEGSLPDPTMPPHVEFLIDRQGYIRARWISGDGVGWTEMKNLFREVERLSGEKPSVLAPDEHVH